MRYGTSIELHPSEKRTYQALGAVSFVTWLGGFALWIATASTVPWIASIIGGIGAMAFGSAIRYRYQIWPFSLFWPRAAPSSPIGR
jgi:hypothetical protein